MRTMAASLILTLAAPAAFAHTGMHPAEGFVHGLAHPLAGLDHLLAMLAVGFWTASTRSAPRWPLPVAFLATMLIGGALGAAGIPLAGGEVGVAASVLLLGLLVAFRTEVHGIAALALVGLFAIFHGHAHGAELVSSASFAAYASGFAAATVVLMATGMALGFATTRLPVIYRYVGAIIGAAGAVLLDQAN